MKKLRVVFVVLFCLSVLVVSYVKLRPKKITDILREYGTEEMFI